MIESKLSKVIYVKGILKLNSPLLIGNGESEFTKNDLIKDSNGEPFIPGTSIAGAIRAYLKRNKDITEEELNIIFGIGNTKSLIYFYDLNRVKKGEITVRDGNNLALSKLFNYEVLEIDNTFEFKLKVTLRENNVEYLEEKINIILNILKDGYISLGSSKNRGFGNVVLDKTEVLYFDFEDSSKEIKKKLVEEYLNFNWNNDWTNYQVSKEEGELINEKLDTFKNEKVIEIKTDINIRDTLNVRSYISQNSLGYSKQLEFNERFIIPGTSIAGVFRTRIIDILNDIGLSEEERDRYLNYLFGNNNSSGVLKFHEIRDKNQSNFIDITRNSIDRFSGGASKREKKLFTNRILAGGKGDLRIEIINGANEDVSLILTVIEDLLSGYISIGGEKAVGRGLLVHNDDFEIDKNRVFINSKTLDEYSRIALKKESFNNK